MRNLNFARTYSQLKSPKYFTQIFRTIEAIPKENVGSSCPSKSFKLMLQHGLIASSSSGIYNLLPLTLMSIEKLCKLVDNLMEVIGGQKVLLPTLAHSSFWKKSGRWSSVNNELFKLKDRHSVDYCLGPTHEEIITKTVSNFHPSMKNLPLKLYQISTKFRDEMNPKLGLLRGREFIMKDMYSFDASEESAKETYASVCEAYCRLFQLLNVDWVQVEGSNAGMGGSVSHEYHFLSDVGEDEVHFCPMCRMGVNAEVFNGKSCVKCNSALQKRNAIEVGHTFILGRTYSVPFDANFKQQDGSFKPLEMGCYGLGMTRIIAASIECLSDEERIRWPLLISPFLISIIPPKLGSKEEGASHFVNFLLKSLRSIHGLADEIAIDDRAQFTIGKRVNDSNVLGIPYAIVVGKMVLQDIPKFEVIDFNKKKQMFLSHAELMSYFRNFSIRLTQKWDDQQNKL